MEDFNKWARQLIKDLNIASLAYDPGIDENGYATGNIVIVIKGRYK